MSIELLAHDHRTPATPTSYSLSSRKRSLAYEGLLFDGLRERLLEEFRVAQEENVITRDVTPQYLALLASMWSNGVVELREDGAIGLPGPNYGFLRPLNRREINSLDRTARVVLEAYEPHEQLRYIPISVMFQGEEVTLLNLDFHKGRKIRLVPSELGRLVVEEGNGQIVHGVYKADLPHNELYHWKLVAGKIPLGQRRKVEKALRRGNEPIIIV